MYYEDKNRNKDRLILYFGMIIIIVLLCILLIRTMGEMPLNESVASEYNAEKASVIPENDNINNEEKNENTNIIEKSIDSIVGISKLKESGSSVFVKNAEEKLGLGSGVIITENGFILTNCHVARKQI